MIIAVVGLVVVFVLLLVFSNRRTRGCRWREDRTRDDARGRCYHCMACGAVSFTKTGRPPKICFAAAQGEAGAVETPAAEAKTQAGMDASRPSGEKGSS